MPLLSRDHLSSVSRRDYGKHRQLVANTVALSANRNQASAAQRGQALPFRSDRPPGLRIIERLQRSMDHSITRPALNCQRALPGCGTQHLRRKPLTDGSRLLQPVKPGGCQDNCICLPLPQLGQARVHIPAKLNVFKIGPPRPQLRLATQAAGAHHRT